MLNCLDQKYYVIIGSKPIMNYVTASLTLFNQGSKKIIIRARGRNIPKAVDATELLRRVFLKDIIIEDITIDTDVLERKDKVKANISIIQIILSKKF
ncbi:DNA-binding protein Alba [Candidatus Bathyarchaeota archaeon]|nr:DNA-binding protein Alba [Candidatus Bathyarchaeota archaeon]